MTEHATRERIRGLVDVDRIAQFAAVGTAGTAVDVLLLGLFHGLLGIGLVVGKLAAAELSFVFMFVINEHWTFEEFGSKTGRARFRRFVRSNAVRLAGLATATVVLVWLTRTTDLWYQIANVIGIAVGFVVNYSFESTFTWQVHDEIE